MRTLILGGARSGTSALAERLARDPGLEVVYIATAQAHDAEIVARIEHHRDRRPVQWQSVEEPLALANTLSAYAQPDRCVLVDCLTLWLSNLLFAGVAARQAENGEAVDCPFYSGHVQALLEVLPQCPGQIIIVSNEVGWGIVPMSPVSRLFAESRGD